MNIISQLEIEIRKAHEEHGSEITRIRELETKAQEDFHTNIEDSFTLAFEEILPKVDERIDLYEKAKKEQVDQEALKKAREFIEDLGTKRYRKAMKGNGPVKDMLIKERETALELIRKSQTAPNMPKKPLAIPIRLHQHEDGDENVVEISYPISSSHTDEALLGYIARSVAELGECESLNSVSHQKYTIKGSTAKDIETQLLSKISENDDLNRLFRFRVFTTGSATSTSRSPEPGAVIPPSASLTKSNDPLYSIPTRELAERVGEDYNALMQAISKDPALKGMKKRIGVTNFYTEEAVEHVREKYAGKLDGLREKMKKKKKAEEVQGKPETEPKSVDDVVDNVLDGGTEEPETESESQAARGPRIGSTKKGRMERNRKIKRMALSGMGPKEIAVDLGYSRGTIENTLRDAGIFSWRYVQHNYSSLDHVRAADISGVNCFTNPEKQKIRNNLKMMIVQHIKKPLRYLGLEGGNLASYIDLCKNFTVAKRKSMIVERNDKTYQVMKSFQKHRKFIKGGEILGGIKIIEGRMSDTVEKIEGNYNVLNLDYMGVLNDEKIRTLVTLFDQGQIADTAILALTFNNNELSLTRFAEGSGALGKHSLNGFKSRDQYGITKEILQGLSDACNYTLTELDSIKYQGKHTPMLYMCFKLEKKN